MKETMARLSYQQFRNGRCRDQKRLWLVWPGRVVLEPQNPAYKLIVAGRGQERRILGKVVEVRRRPLGWPG